MHRISGVLLALAGVYLTYYWGRILFGPLATLADDPIVGTVQRLTTRVERMATAHAETILTASMIAVVAVAAYMLWRLRHPDVGPGCAGEHGSVKDTSQDAIEHVDARIRRATICRPADHWSKRRGSRGKETSYE